eukprot:scaffold2744_cov136-Cylindrotheca_fusiformis.AAC.3
MSSTPESTKPADEANTTASNKPVEETTTAASNKPADESKTTASNKPAEKEAVSQKAARESKNVFQRCLGCLKTTDDKAMIKYKEMQIANRKKEFGVVYVDLLRKNATEEELKKATDDCMKDIDAFVKEIEKFENEIEKVNKETESKIIKPGTPAASAKVDEKKKADEKPEATAEKKDDEPEQPPAEKSESA